MKHALILSGGGALGAFQAGFLSEEGRSYDLVAGVSAGALNGALVAQWDFAALKQIWYDIADNPNLIFHSKAFTKRGRIRPFGAIRQLLGFKSMASNKPLRKLIKKYVSLKDMRSEFVLGTVSLTDNRFHSITKQYMTNESVTDALIASSSIPALFEPVEELRLKGYSLTNCVDGGIGSSTALGMATTWIKAKYPDEDWSLTIVLTRDDDVNFEHINNNIFSVAARSIEALSYHNFRKDLEIFDARNYGLAHKHFTYRIIRPTIEMPSPYDIREHSILTSIREGQRIAKGEKMEESWQT